MTGYQTEDDAETILGGDQVMKRRDYHANETVFITVRLPKDVYDRIKGIADRETRCVSDQVAHLLKGLFGKRPHQGEPTIMTVSTRPRRPQHPDRPTPGGQS